MINIQWESIHVSLLPQGSMAMGKSCFTKLSNKSNSYYSSFNHAYTSFTISICNVPHSHSNNDLSDWDKKQLKLKEWNEILSKIHTNNDWLCFI